jgi:hypothetical protein
MGTQKGGKRMGSKKHLGFGPLRKTLSEQFIQLPDHRQQTKVVHNVHDAMMSGFACMFFQDRSLVQFQKRLEEEGGLSNLQTLFGVSSVPEDTQMREIIDGVDSQLMRPIFNSYFSALQRGKHLEPFQLLPGLYLCPIDGTQYFSSQNIHCPGCLQSNHSSGKVFYSHKVVQAGIMHPDIAQVIPLMPEEIRNTDGSLKQDCEINAAKRLIWAIRKDHPRLGLIITGDGLYSKQPFISEVLAASMHYIFVAKPDDHVFMMEWVEAFDEIEQMRSIDAKGRIHVYEWVNDIPLNGSKNTINVNYFQYKIISIGANGDEKIHYQNSWVTDLEVTKENVAILVRGARCRWKVENECFNTLKNQGYHVEHNYGHGSKNLCFNFYLLTLLAFYVHQIFELTDRLYQRCRRKFGSKQHMWETLRSYIKIIIFDTWEQLLDFALTPLKYNPSLRPS